MSEIDPDKIKALFFDIDGTLASSRDHLIHHDDIESLRLLQNKGIMLFVATGRDLLVTEEAKILNPVLPYFTGFIHVNGQQLSLNDGRMISEHPIADEDFLPLRAACEEHHIAMLYRIENLNILTNLTFNVKRYWPKMGLDIPEIRPMEQDLQHITKLCIHASPEDEAKWLSPYMNHTWTARITEELIDLIPNGVGKSSGLREMCEYFRISPDETIAFGDGQNDLDLLEAAGFAVAMENGADNVKEKADFITLPPEQAGITHALKHFGLI